MLKGFGRVIAASACTLTSSSLAVLACCCTTLLGWCDGFWCCLDLFLLLPLFGLRSISNSLSLSPEESDNVVWPPPVFSLLLSSPQSLQLMLSLLLSLSTTRGGKCTLLSKPLSPINAFTALIRPTLAVSDPRLSQGSLVTQPAATAADRLTKIKLSNCEDTSLFCCCQVP